MNHEKFLQDVISGLQAEQKYLHSKYFYDKEGDKIFEKIMHSRDYYLTRCELEIFKTHKQAIADAVSNGAGHLDIIALGPGDSSKTIYLIEELNRRKKLEKYFPIDISRNIIDSLEPMFKTKFPRLKFHGLAAEYFEALPQVLKVSSNKRLVFFVGATIGNFTSNEVKAFCRRLSKNLEQGDMVLIGFDLKKDPRVILRAYDDHQGLTARFNLNLLRRINKELGADFDLRKFSHFPSYEPLTGACRSFLISTSDQTVNIQDRQVFLKQGEPIYTEVSQKYTPGEIEALANATGFRQVASFSDSKNYFLDVLWEVV